MSFGFSPSDIVALVNIVSKTYQGWKKACGEYADVTATLDNLSIILNRIEDESRRPGSILVRTPKDAADLKDVLSNTTPTVRELHAIVERYKSLGLGKSREKNWDKIRFGVRNLNDIRSKLNQHLAALSAYLNTVGLSSLTRIERGLETLPQIKEKVDALAAEIRAGRREGTVMTTYEDDEKEVWKQFRRELVGEGMKSNMIHKYKPQIRAYLRVLAERGELEEQPVDEDDSEPPDDMYTGDVDPEAEAGSKPAVEESAAASELSDSEVPPLWDVETLDVLRALRYEMRLRDFRLRDFRNGGEHDNVPTINYEGKVHVLALTTPTPSEAGSACHCEEKDLPHLEGRLSGYVGPMSSYPSKQSYNEWFKGVEAAGKETQRLAAAFTVMADGKIVVNPKRPTYPKHDQQDSAYIVILLELEDYQVQMLFDHTRELRESGKYERAQPTRAWTAPRKNEHLDERRSDCLPTYTPRMARAWETPTRTD